MDETSGSIQSRRTANPEELPQKSHRQPGSPHSKKSIPLLRVHQPDSAHPDIESTASVSFRETKRHPGNTSHRAQKPPPQQSLRSSQVHPTARSPILLQPKINGFSSPTQSESTPSPISENPNRTRVRQHVPARVHHHHPEKPRQARFTPQQEVDTPAPHSSTRFCPSLYRKYRFGLVSGNKTTSGCHQASYPTRPASGPPLKISSAKTPAPFSALSSALSGPAKSAQSKSLRSSSQ